MAAEFVIGRDPGCDLVLDDPTVSKRHATVTLDGDRVVLSDCSRNGTFLRSRAGGRDKLSRHVLAAGQVVCFAAAELTAEVLVQHLSRHFDRPLSLSPGQATPGPGAQVRAFIRRPVPRSQSAPPAPEPEPALSAEPVSEPEPTPQPAAPPAVLMCGASGAGKTMWLVRLFDHLGLAPAPDLDGPLAQMRAGLPPAAGAVPAECRVVVGPPEASVALRLRDSAGTGSVEGDVAALLCFASADPVCRAAHRSAIVAARSRFRGPAVLVLSHCDRFLAPDHWAWTAETGWWRALPDGGWWDDLAQTFAGGVFPLGSVGHVGAAEASCPDEFGNTVFLSAPPVGIERPLRHLANHVRRTGS